MAQSIESFVAKLQQEGIEAGEEAASALKEKARREAEEIIHLAQAEARKIIGKARAEAETTLSRGKTDLELAVRDALLRLREALNEALGKVLAQGTKKVLGDEEFIKSLIRDLVIRYAEADIKGEGVAKINVSPETQKNLAEWVIKELHPEALERAINVDLKGELRHAGFEYNIGGGTVEVTEDSVVEVLRELVSPRLQELLGGKMPENSSTSHN